MEEADMSDGDLRLGNEICSNCRHMQLETPGMGIALAKCNRCLLSKCTCLMEVYTDPGNNICRKCVAIGL